MKILIATDAWDPQTNGVVITLKNLGKQLINNKNEVYYITPKMFKTIPCPTYAYKSNKERHTLGQAFHHIGLCLLRQYLIP